MPTTNLYRGSASGFTTISEGDCFTEQPTDALAYCRGRRGSCVIEVEIDLDALVVEETEAEVDCPWPGDLASDRRAFAARGVDVIFFADLGADAHGRGISCWRLVSDRAAAAVQVVKIWSHEEADEEWGWIS